VERSDTSAEAVTLISIADACGRLGVSRATLYRLMSSGALPTVRIGARRLIRVADLRDLIVARVEYAPENERSPAGQPSFASASADELRGHDRA
jgi:excisionase family DNA binding protein